MKATMGFLEVLLITATALVLWYLLAAWRFNVGAWSL